MLGNIFNNTKIRFMRLHKAVIAISSLLIILSISLILTKGFNLGIDFSGGVLMEIRSAEKIDVSKIRKLLDSNGIEKSDIQNFNENDVMIRLSKSENQEESIKKIQSILNQNIPNVEYRKIDSVGPQVGSELIKKGFLAIFFSFLSIMIYLWFRFDWQFGIGAVLAVVHDVVVTLGFFSLTGIEFNLTSIAAILTIIGYSMNDSVVIYDRIRENLRKFKKMDLSELIDSSLNSTLSRTMLTSGITLLSLIALVLFGGEVLRSFSLSVFFGIFIGTFSSIYISAPILLYLDPRKKEISNK